MKRRIGAGGLGVLVCVAGWFAVGADGPPESPESLRARQQQKQAAERFLTVLEKTPRRGTAFDRLYGYHIEAGSLAEWIRGFEERAAAGAEPGTAWMILGLIESQRGRDAQAGEAFRKAEALRSDDPMAPYYLGQSLVLVGQPEEAAAAFERAIARKPQRADLLDVFQALGRVHQRAQKGDAALAVWNRLEKLFPGDQRVQEQIAMTLAEEGQTELALPRFEALAARTKDEYRSANFRIEAADIKVRLGRRDEAVADFEALLGKLNPDSWLFRDVRRRLDETFLRNDDRTGLIAYYEGWITRNPEDVEAAARLARLLAGQGRAGEARALLDKTLKRAPSRKDLRLALVEQLVVEKDFAQAAGQYELLAKNDPGNPDLLREWGRLILKDTARPEAERKAAAAAVWRKLLEARPKDSLTATQTADLFRQAQMTDEALELYRRAVELSPEATQYREYLGEYYHALKRNDEALATWREIATGERRTAANLARLAEVLAGFGHLPEAIESIQAASRADDDEFRYPMKAAELQSRAGQHDAALTALDRAEKLAEGDEDRERVLRHRIENLQLADRLRSQSETLAKELTGGEEATAARWFLLARYREALRDLAPAVEAIHRALELDETSIRYRTTEARLHEAVGKLQEAADSYRRLAAIDRRSRTAHLTQVARIEVQLGRIEPALAAGREVLEAAPGNPESFEFYAQLCFQLGKTDEGLEALRRSVRLNPSETKGMLSLAAVLAERLRTDEAIELYWRAFEKAGDLEEKLGIVASLTDLHLQTNHFDRLLERLERQRREPGLERSLTICLAQAYQSAGDYGTARQELERVGQQARDVEILQQLSNLSEREGDVVAAARYQQQVVAAAPGPENELRLAILLTEAEETEAAAAIWSRVGASEANPLRRLDLIDGLLSHEQREPARSIIERRLRDEPQNWELLYRAGTVLAETDPDEAARRFTELLALALEDAEPGVRLRERQARERAGAASRGPVAGELQQFMENRFWVGGQIRSAVGLESSGWWGWQSGSQGFWAPADFGQARMASLGWLMRFAQKQDRLGAFIAARRPDPARPPDARALWDWFFIVTLRDGQQDTYDAARQLARTGEPLAQWLYLTSLDARSARDRTQLGQQGRGDEAEPPLAGDELLEVVESYRALAARRPALLFDEGMGEWVLGKLLEELKRSMRPDISEEIYRQTLAGADRPGRRAILAGMAIERDEPAVARAQIEQVLADESAWTVSAQWASPINSILDPLARLMDLHAEAGEFDAVLGLLDGVLDGAARRRAAAAANQPNQGMFGGGGQAFWVGKQRANLQEESPLSNECISPLDEFVLHEAFALFRHHERLEELLEHCQRRAGETPAGARPIWRLGLCVLHYWREAPDEALAELARAALAAPGEPKLAFELARLQQEQGSVEEALAVIDGVRPADHKMMLEREMMALRLAARTGNVDRAQRAAERLFGLRIDADTQIQLVAELRRLNMHAHAEAVLARAHRQAGNRVGALMNLMNQFFADQKTDMAVQAAHEILRRVRPPGPTSSQSNNSGQDEAARRQAISILARSGKLPELIRRIEAELVAAPSSVPLLRSLLEYHEANSDEAATLATMERIAAARPDDMALRLDVGLKIAAAKRPAEALPLIRAALLKEPKLLGGNNYYEIVQFFEVGHYGSNRTKRSDRAEALVDLLVERGIAAFPGDRLQETMTNLLQDEKERPLGVRLFREIWKADPERRQRLLMALRDDDVWRLPEIYDFAREGVIPRESETVRDPWSGFGSFGNDGGNRVNCLMGRLIEAADRLDRIEPLRDEVAQAVDRFPAWRAGKALLAILESRLGRTERAVAALEGLWDGMRPPPAPVAGLVAQEIEANSALRPWVFRLYEGFFEGPGAAGSLDSLGESSELFDRLVRLYRRSGRLEEGRQLFLRLAKAPLDDAGDSNEVLAKRIHQVVVPAQQLLGLGFAADAATLLRDLLEKGPFEQRARVDEAVDRLLVDGRSTYGEAVATLARREAQQALDLLLAAREEGIVELAIDRNVQGQFLRSAAFEALRTAAEDAGDPKAIAARAVELGAKRPDDLGAQVLALAAAVSFDGRKDVVESAAERLWALLERTPLPELKAGSPPSDRQRGAAGRQMAVWVAARECLNGGEYDRIGERLGERALAAARLQEELAEPIAILKEWGELALARERPQEAERRWGEWLDVTLADEVSVETPRGEQRTKTAPVPLMLLKEALALADQASQAGLDGLALRAVRLSLAGGPPDESDDGSRGRNGSRRSMGMMHGWGGREDPIRLVQTALSALTRRWASHRLPPSEQYDALADVVLPPGRPAEVFLYAPSLSGDPNRSWGDGDVSFGSVSWRLANLAVQAERVDDLRGRVELRRDQPLAHLPARVLLGELAIAAGDDMRAAATLQEVLDHLRTDPLQNSAELAAHLAYRALSRPALAQPAAEILEQAGRRLATADRRESAAAGELFLLAGTAYLRADRADAARQVFREALDFSRSLAATMGSGWSVSALTRNLPRIADESARAGLPGDALDALGQLDDQASSDPNGWRESGPPLALVARFLRRMPPGERFELLKSWSLPTASRQSIRFLSGFVPRDDAPAPFRALAAWNRGIDPQPGDRDVGDADGLITTASMLVDAARDAGRLEELRNELRELASRGIVGAASLELLAGLSQPDPASVYPAVTQHLSTERARHEAAAAAQEERQRSHEDADEEDDSGDEEPGPKKRTKALDVAYPLLVRAALMHAPLQDEAERARKAGMGQPEFGRYHGGRYNRGNDRNVAAAEKLPGVDLAHGVQPGLPLWQSTARRTGKATERGQVPVWIGRDRHIVHASSEANALLYFAWPLVGEFELSVEVPGSPTGQPSLGYGGLMVGHFANGSAPLVQAIGTEHSTSRPGAAVRQDFNRLAIQVHADGWRYVLNGQTVYEARGTSSSSPFLVLGGSGGHSVFRNLTLRGDVRIPREVRLVQDDHLEGWIPDYLESFTDPFVRPRSDGRPAAARLLRPHPQMMWAYRNQMNWQGNDDDSRSRAKQRDDVWRAAAGVLSGDVNIVSDNRRGTQSRLYWHRPLRNGEAISWEFLHEPGRAEVHPALGRLAFLLEPDGARLHWMTAGPDLDPASGLAEDNAADEPASRRGPEVLPLRAGQWNAARLALIEDSVSLELNGVEVLRRPIEPQNDRTFGFFRWLPRSVRVRNVVLRGDWPERLTDERLAALIADPAVPLTAELRSAQDQLIHEEVLADNWRWHLEHARAVPAAARYELLRAWVLPGPTHDTFQLRGGFTPLNPPPRPGSTASGAGGARRRVDDGGDLVSPALDLVDTAKDLGRLDELAGELQKNASGDEKSPASRAALLALVQRARGDVPGALTALRQVRSAIEGLPPGKRDRELWSVLVAASLGLESPELREEAVALLEPLSAPKDEKRESTSEPDPAVVRLRQRLLEASDPGRLPGSTQWAPVTLATRRSRGSGVPPAVWRASAGEARHVAGHERDGLYFQSPLSGRFEVRAKLSAEKGRELFMGYGAEWLTLDEERKGYQVVRLDHESNPRSVDPTDSPPPAVSEYRLVIDDGSQTLYVDGRKLRAEMLPAGSDPWLFLMAPGLSQGTAHDVRIIGQPTIPDRLDLLERPDLSGWVGSYLEERTDPNSPQSYRVRNARWRGHYGGQSSDEAGEALGTWRRDGDELVADRAEQGQNGRRAEPGQGQGQDGRQASLLSYHRPLLEDGSITYEFQYVPGKRIVHPALDRLTLLLTPEGVRVHWITDAPYDDSGLDPDNVTDEPANRRGAARLPLKERDWNQVTLTLAGDNLALHLNGELIYERPIEPTNQRTFGLFHYAGESSVRVRRITYRGDWPRTLPALADQDLAAPEQEKAGKP